MKRYSFFVLLFVLLWLPHLPAVDLNSTFYTTNDGLGNNFVRHIYQDSKGFLWMSTLNGLTRYDGHTFLNFQPKKGDKISLADHHVREVAEDKNNFLWIQISPEFFSCYDLKNEQYVDFTGIGEHKEKFSNRFEANNGDSWLWESNGGCRRIRYSDKKFTSMLFNLKNKKLPSNNVRKIREDRNGNIWVCTDKGVVKITETQNYNYKKDIYIEDIVFNKNKIFVLSNTASIYKLDEKSKTYTFIIQLDANKINSRITTNFTNKDNWIVITPVKGHVFNLRTEKVTDNELFDIANGQISKDDRGNVCFYNDKGIVRYFDFATGQVKEFHIPIKDMVVNNWCRFLQDSRGWVWFATFGNGLYIYNPINDEVTHFENKIGAENYIGSNSLAYITEDRSGGIWISSESAGLTHISVLENNITYLFPENMNIMNNSNSVRLIHAMKNGEIWIGNRDGELYRYNSQMTKQIEKKQFASSIYSILEENDGKIWYGSRGHGLFVDKLNITKGSDTFSLPSEKISIIFNDFKNRKWIGTFTGGLSLMKQQDNRITFQNFYVDSAEATSFRSIISDKNNWMWVGTDDGLIVFHPDSLIASPDNYYQYNFDNDKLLAQRVKHVFRDSKNRIWLGTLGGGISMCQAGNDYSNLTFTHYTTNQGLSNNVVQSITEDMEGKIWIATEYGLSRFSPETSSFENFFFSKLLQGNIFNENSVLRLTDNRLLFGTYHGILIIDPRNIKTPSPIKNITFTDLKVNGISMQPNDDDSPLTHSITYSDEIELKYNQNSFSIEFSTFDFSNTKTSKYTYKLEPYDTDWSTPSIFNFAVYKKLPPGTYHLRVKACNSAGIWSEIEANLEIKIKPPFWKTPLAYLIYFILVGAIILLSFRILKNFYTLRNRLQLEQQLTDYKLRFFTNISHEFRTPLALIKGAMEKIEDTNNISKELNIPLQIMKKSTDRMLRLINQLLEFRKMQHNKLVLALEQMDVITLFYEIYHNFEEIAHDKQINYRFEPSVQHYNMFIDKEKADKIVYNLLSNAFKYTPTKGDIVFSVNVDENSHLLSIKVSDTGVGIPLEKQGELFSRFMQSSFSNDSVGIGLHLTHELVNVHKGKITYIDLPKGGSEFTVTLPLDTSGYSKEDFLKEQFLLNTEVDTDIISNENNPDEPNCDKKPANSRKILLIEDDIDICKFLSNELSNCFDVITANDGITGLEKAQSFDGDLIICDVLMPGMNGFEVTRQLKNNFETSHIPIILLTAMSSAEHQLEGIQAGADSYITKPFSPKYLIARILKLIEQRENLQTKFSQSKGIGSYQINFTDKDKEFIEKIQQEIMNNLTDTEFSVDTLSEISGIKRTNFYKKMKSITGHSPNEYINVIRMKKAAELLATTELNISEISYEVGIEDPSYFIRFFKSQFGKTPLQFRKDKG